MLKAEAITLNFFDFNKQPLLSVGIARLDVVYGPYSVAAFPFVVLHDRNSHMGIDHFQAIGFRIHLTDCFANCRSCYDCPTAPTPDTLQVSKSLKV